jgi:NAD+ synthase
VANQDPATWGAVADRLAGWIAAQVQGAAQQGTVIGLSGGVDSAVVAALTRRAVGDQALAVIMPCHSAAADVADAQLVASTLGLATVTVDLGPTYDLLTGQLDGVHATGRAQPEAASARLANANLKPRLRMMTLYHFANRYRLLVVGTGNRSEFHVGYSTKYGDAGVDIQPIANLLKREVRALAAAVGLPESIVHRVPSAGLWPGQTDEGEMGLSYEELDTYIATGQARPAVKAQVDRLHQVSDHKRRVPPVPPDFPLPPL